MNQYNPYPDADMPSNDNVLENLMLHQSKTIRLT